MVTRFQTGDVDVFLEILTSVTVGLIEKGLLFPEKILFYDWDLIELSKFLEYTNDHKLYAPIICMF